MSIDLIVKALIDEAISDITIGVDFLFTMAEKEKIEGVENTLINIVKERKNLEVEGRGMNG